MRRIRLQRREIMFHHNERDLSGDRPDTGFVGSLHRHPYREFTPAEQADPSGVLLGVVMLMCGGVPNKTCQHRGGRGICGALDDQGQRRAQLVAEDKTRRVASALRQRTQQRKEIRAAED
jgi:hypothetical protein